MKFPSSHNSLGFTPARPRTGWTGLTAAEITNLEITLVINQRGLQTQAEVRALVDEIMRSRKPPAAFLDPGKPLSEPDQARRIICEAFNANGRKRAKLAERALKIWPLCADAHLLLAAEEEGEAREEILEEGLSVAREVIEQSYGESVVAELFGDIEDEEVPLVDKSLKQLTAEAESIKFWADPETRPYIRLEVELAKTYHELEEPPVLYLAHLRRALRLCPNDNVGARFLLTPFLMELALRDPAYLDELGVLLKRYTGEDSTEWFYARVWYLSEKDEVEAAERTLRRAFAANRWIPAIITGVIDPPAVGDHLIQGSQAEAADYCLWNMDAWSASTKAKVMLVSWFGKLIEEAVENGEIESEG